MLLNNWVVYPEVIIHHPVKQQQNTRVTETFCPERQCYSVCVVFFKDHSGLEQTAIVQKIEAFKTTHTEKKINSVLTRY